MVAVIATFTVVESKIDEFETIVKKLTMAVRANESGNKQFDLVRTKKQPGLYMIIEKYDSKDDLRAHGGSEWFQSAFAEMKTLLSSEPVIEVFEPVV